uniref:LRAT domain-containing protein n=1 Tax=Chromera velia CCMP2878 TaxID=1169474 RepID=A0A0G4G0H3_9ALVE|eukprot:Cvel_4013.t1-p1 / transcript=Cvel_4013.t1 / gene=Cvel_4013 / organism=Chromera_velia_CCMP2878 / gene_product=hypothetical protein / transcript_product=hypothetical protein / location=Cvel_scaffold170:113299-115364(-) / protein_length=609 / sequence_SO=supercontig / SO=protein_coding / is_pseudo=false
MPDAKTPFEKVVIHLDESVNAKLRIRRRRNLPTLYVDDYTIMQRVSCYRELKRGDHLMFGLNPIRKIHPFIDAFVFFLADWEILRLYHHCIMLDDVESVSEEGLALNAEGKPARIAEYSNTPTEATMLLLKFGPWVFINNLAPFFVLPLADYIKGNTPIGIFKVLGELSEEERDETVREALELTQHFDEHGKIVSECPEKRKSLSYQLFFNNCEHAAFKLSRHTRREVSPQVARYLWTLARWIVQGISCLYLAALVPYYAAQTPPGHPSVSVTSSHQPPGLASLFRPAGPAGEGPLVEVSIQWFLPLFFELMYHLTASLPVYLYWFITLVRVVVNLTHQRARLGEEGYHHLLAKEGGRAVIAGGFSTLVLVCMPYFVRLTGRADWAAVVVLGAVPFADACYGFLAQLAVRALYLILGGVPVALFEDARMKDEVEQRRKEVGEAAFSPCISQSSSLASLQSEPSRANGGKVRLAGGGLTKERTEEWGGATEEQGDVEAEWMNEAEERERARTGGNVESSSASATSSALREGQGQGEGARQRLLTAPDSLSASSPPPQKEGGGGRQRQNRMEQNEEGGVEEEPGAEADAGAGGGGPLLSRSSSSASTQGRM